MRIAAMAKWCLSRHKESFLYERFDEICDIMTGSTTQATIDAVDLLAGTAAGDAAAVRTRLSRLAMSVLVFAAGCAAGALLYWLTGFWCLAIPVMIGAVAAFMRLDETAQ